MSHRTFASLLTSGLLAVATACGQSSDTVQKTSESTTRTAEGTTRTTTESTQVGATLDSKSETKVETPSGTVRANSATVVGTVTVFNAGKTLEVMTGEKKMHSFNLGDTEVVYSVDGDVTVGKRVTVVDETGQDKVHRVTVKVAAG